MSLEEIKHLMENRAPSLTYDFFSKQIVKIDEKIETWVRARKLLFTIQNAIRSAMSLDEKEIVIRF
ncbi:MAG: hypothetical protein FWH42_01725 [Dehalococcoidia bacterium]|nr:hypothetical protein [Dehalococcoidia bacterium]